MSTIGSPAKTWPRDKFRQRQEAFEKVRAEYQDEIARIRQGGGAMAIKRQPGSGVLILPAKSLCLKLV